MKRHRTAPVPGRALRIALIGFLLPWLAACGPGPTATPLPSPLVVTDALSRTVSLAGPPQRIVLAGRNTLPVADTLYLFPEAAARLAALTVGKQPVGDFLGLVDAGFPDKTILQVDAGPEVVAALRPDVVLLRPAMAEALGRPLETLGIAVVYLDPETPERFFRDVALLGRLLGNPERAAEIEASYRARLNTLAQAVGSLAPAQKPRLLLVQHSEQGGEVALSVPSAAWMQTLQAELAGGTPVWKEAATGGGWTVVSLEQIAAWDPDSIVVISYSGDSAAVADRLAADPKWAALRATQAGRLFGFPADIFSWDQPDPRWILGATWLAVRLHPDRFPGLDVTEEATTFFTDMYRLDPGLVRERLTGRLRGDVR